MPDSPTSDADITATLLRAGLDSWGFRHTDIQINQLLTFRDMLVDWNANRMNLTRIVEPSEVATEHFLDSLSVLKYCTLRRRSTLLDVGTGAGFPGLVIKVFRPDIEVTLLESTGKKLNFCRAVSEELKLDGVDFVHGRAEMAPWPVPLNSFDAVTTRAVGSMAKVIEWCAPYMRRDNGQLIALKGAKAQEEIDEAKGLLRRFGLEATPISADIPGSEKEHIIVCCRPVKKPIQD